MEYLKTTRNQDFNSWWIANREYFIWLLCEYISIDTTTPNERTALPFLIDTLQKSGFDSISLKEADASKNKSENIFSHPDRNSWFLRATKNGTSKRSVLFSSHIDVVPAEPGQFIPRCVDGCIWGRGACDTKNNFVMLIAALHFLIESQRPLTRTLHCDLVPEEEIGGLGACLAANHPIHALEEVIVLEPTSLLTFEGHRGALGFSILVAPIETSCSHMGAEHAVRNPINVASSLIVSLEEFEVRQHESLCGMYGHSHRPLPVNVAHISGGHWHGSQPEQCLISGNVGYDIDKSGTFIENELQNICCKIADQFNGISIKLNLNGIKNRPYQNPAQIGRFPKFTSKALSQIKSGMTWSASCDAREYALNLQVPTYIFGSGNLDEAHSKSEYAAISQIAIGAETLADYLSS